jgi:hypothetical protein
MILPVGIGHYLVVAGYSNGIFIWNITCLLLIKIIYKSIKTICCVIFLLQGIEWMTSAKKARLFWLILPFF